MISVLVLLLSAARADPLDDEPTDYIAQAVLAREAELLATVQQQDPLMYARLVKLKDVDRVSYVTSLYRVSKLVEKARLDPAFAERLRQIRDKEARLRTLAAGFSSLPAAQQATRRAELEKVAQELMDLKQAERRDRLAELQSRLDELAREIEAREADREKIVDQYVDQLVRGGVEL